MFDVIEKDLERLEEGLYKAIEAPEELVTKVGEHLVAAGESVFDRRLPFSLHMEVRVFLWNAFCRWR